MSSSNASGKRGASPFYVNGKQSKLIVSPRDHDDAGVIGCWSAEQLEKMDQAFVAAT
jgi:hypothetical protein